MASDCRRTLCARPQFMCFALLCCVLCAADTESVDSVELAARRRSGPSDSGDSSYPHQAAYVARKILPKVRGMLPVLF